MRAVAVPGWILLAGGGAAALAVTVSSCNQSVQADLGLDAYMQIPGAQFFRGPMPAGSKAGPAVLQLSLIGNEIWPGLQTDPLTGALAPSATAAAIGLRNDVGYWVVTAGVPAIATPNDPSYAANLVFSTGIVPGGYTLVVRAVDGSGNFGPPSTQVLTAESSPTNPPPMGDLVFSLTWDTESNLNLHVVDPDGVELYWGNESTMPQSDNLPEGGSYGTLDYDSNANCVIDGLRREDATWPNAPPLGQYTVRVDTRSLCGQPDANWTVKVRLYGKLVAEASGVALDADTWGSHGPGAGVLALQYTVK
jgi:hypothetical protein